VDWGDKDFFLRSVNHPSLLSIQISMRYLQFGQSADIGKKSSVAESLT
jgi:hypothetical protein